MRTIQFEYDDTVYTLEYDRKTFVNAENSGFRMENIMEQPLKSTTILFMFGLQKNHPTLQQNKVDKILDNFLNEYVIDEFLSFVMEEYHSFMLTTQSNSEKKKSLNIQIK